MGQRGALNKLIISFTAALLNTSLPLQLRFTVAGDCIEGKTVHSFDLAEKNYKKQQLLGRNLIKTLEEHCHSQQFLEHGIVAGFDCSFYVTACAFRAGRDTDDEVC